MQPHPSNKTLTLPTIGPESPLSRPLVGGREGSTYYLGKLECGLRKSASWLVHAPCCTILPSPGMSLLWKKSSTHMKWKLHLTMVLKMDEQCGTTFAILFSKNYHTVLITAAQNHASIPCTSKVTIYIFHSCSFKPFHAQK